MNKLRQIGFSDIERGEELPYGIAECEQYPMFTPELLALMRRLIHPDRQRVVARSVIYTARKLRRGSPQGGEG